METFASSVDCLIIGAGLAGLYAARELAAAGIPALVLEKEAVAGGRVATETVETERGAAMADVGAQYFTVRDNVFGEQVRGWIAAGVARQWSTGFAVPGASAYLDGYPRYCGSTGMAAIPAHLSQGIAIRLGSQVTGLDYRNGWQVNLSGGERLEARALLLTPPVPQSLALLSAGSIALTADDAAYLSQIDYDPCLAVMAVLARPGRVPLPGGMWPGGARIYWIADNQQKGISAAPCVTIHATPEYSRRRWEAESETIVGELIAEAAPWLGRDVIETRLRRWRYSIPVQLYPNPTLLLERPGPLALAGDAFAGPRVEGAVLSGIAAGKALASALNR
jgi:predicted NAD/FAD-dependent oxidoreductase